jgi:hypothetical protein
MELGRTFDSNIYHLTGFSINISLDRLILVAIQIRGSFENNWIAFNSRNPMLYVFVSDLFFLFV